MLTATLKLRVQQSFIKYYQLLSSVAGFSLCIFEVFYCEHLEHAKVIQEEIAHIVLIILTLAWNIITDNKPISNTCECIGGSYKLNVNMKT